MAQDDAENWQAEARRKQREFYSVWGHKVAWSGAPVEQKQSLKVMIALHLFQIAKNDANHKYRDDDRDRSVEGRVSAIAKKIVKYFSYQSVHVKVIYISCHWKGKMKDEIVFRVDGGALTKYIDSHFGVFDDWQSYLKGNRLQPYQICFPTDGVYTLAPSGTEVLISFDRSPAASEKNRALNIVKVVITVSIITGLCLGIVYAIFPDITEILYVALALITLGFMSFLVYLLIYFTSKK